MSLHTCALCGHYTDLPRLALDTRAVGEDPDEDRRMVQSALRGAVAGAGVPAVNDWGEAVSKWKAIGTAAETAAKRFLQEHGFPDCDGENS